MKRISVTLVALGALAGVALTPRDAHALGPVDIEVGAKVGGATNPADSPQPNPLGVGLGARGGVSIFGFYGGLNALYYLGSSADLTSNAVSSHFSNHAFQFGAELGYGFTFSILTIRPQVGLGTINFSGSSTTTIGGRTVDTDVPGKGYFYLEPGVTGMIGLGLWFVAADANVLLIPSVDQGNGDSKTFTSFTMHGQFGFKI